MALSRRSARLDLLPLLGPSITLVYLSITRCPGGRLDAAAPLASASVMDCVCDGPLPAPGSTLLRQSQFHLIDLAGSERQKHSKVHSER